MKVVDFVVLGFKVVVIWMGENKVEDQEPGADEFVGKTAAVAEIILLDGFVERTRENFR